MNDAPQVGYFIDDTTPLTASALPLAVHCHASPMLRRKYRFSSLPSRMGRAFHDLKHAMTNGVSIPFEELSYRHGLTMEEVKEQYWLAKNLTINSAGYKTYTETRWAVDENMKACAPTRPPAVVSGQVDLVMHPEGDVRH